MNVRRLDPRYRMHDMDFYLGCPEATWLGRVDVPLFIAYRTLRTRKVLDRASGPWALDSGGYGELMSKGRWELPEDEYVDAVHRFAEEIGMLMWAAPQDWVCDPGSVERTGKDVATHQWLTIESYLRLRERGPFIPVIQGWTVAEYVRHVQMYADSGVDLAAEPVVGVGSIAARQNTPVADGIVWELASAGIALHGFGVKTRGLMRYGYMLASADSMAWSLGGRFRSQNFHPMCMEKSCQRCVEFALGWREYLFDRSAHQQLRMV